MPAFDIRYIIPLPNVPQIVLAALWSLFGTTEIHHIVFYLLRYWDFAMRLFP